MIELKKYKGKGITGIVLIDAKWHEQSSGFQNETYEDKIAGIIGGKFYLLSTSEFIKTFGGSQGLSINTQKEITQEEYEKLKKDNGGIQDEVNA